MTLLPKSVNSEDLLHNITEISWDVLEIFKLYSHDIKDSLKFRNKLDIKNLQSGPVTKADLEVSELIKKRIKDKYPSIDWEFLSEEDKKENMEKEFKSNWIWIIDPLDGTKDFINQTGEYAMHLALTFRKRVILGIVLIPHKEELWIFSQGKGTWCESKKYSEKKNFKMSSLTIDQLTVFTSKNHFHGEFENLLNKLSPKNIVGMGSVGYKVASILRGEGDIYISYSLPNGSSPKDWDMAAPSSLIKGAGGYFTDVYGKDIEFLKDNKYEQGGILLASLNENHKDICQLIRNRIY